MDTANSKRASREEEPDAGPSWHGQDSEPAESNSGLEEYSSN